MEKLIIENQPAQQARLKEKRKSQIKYGMMVLLFLLPALAVYSTFNVYGVIMTFYYSTLKWTGIGSNVQSIGFGNFVRLLGDSMLWYALKNNLILVVVSIAVQLPMGLIMALMINAKIKGVKFFRTVYFMPMLLSTVATGILWTLIYDPNFGMLNAFLDAVGLGNLKQGWLGLERTAMISVLITICWQYTPFYMILMKAGLTNIPTELYESANIDGATGLRAFWSITLPLMLETIKTAAILSLVGSLKYFDLIYVMTGGGPNGATELMATYMYKKGFIEFDMGYGSSIAAFMFIVALTITATVQYFTRQSKSEMEV
ncbi:carbohydrate ABC transporter permease [Petroclostridium xylanilyticum]|jgi:raffinose/stachyose/melibiose transport system permease protein|uniref:carbohydrate ABC transporter permease n=1 Tax=Petroclostridium xylanilyticum TaxID=1792311 RepID=UPI000B990C12|nr:sugar ABC transporter permease [Petroclostridium xylanilyticum]